jgi:hypothetical protein
MKLIATGAVFAACAVAQTPGIAEIMSRVAENQARSVDARREFVYHEEQLVALHRGNGKLARQERREYEVTPNANGAEAKLVKFEGKYQDGGKTVEYDKPGYEHKNVDIDAALVDAFSDDSDHRHDADGVPQDLFPLTAKQQRKYDYTLKGVERFHGREVYRVTFQPKLHRHDEEDTGEWKGDALIDAAEFQPVLVTTSLACKIPAPVKVLLGTNVRGVGFSVSYRRFGDGVWFPVSYGGEFDVRAVFFYKRTIALSLKNSDFRRTDVASKIAFDAVSK